MFALLLLAATAAPPSADACWTAETCRSATKADREMSREEARNILIQGLQRRGLAVPAPPSTSQIFSADELASMGAISDAWADCAMANLRLVLPNDFDPIDVVAAAAVDRCVETERYRGAAQRLWIAHGSSLAAGDEFYERQRRTMIRVVASEIVVARSNAAKQKRGIPIPEEAK